MLFGERILSFDATAASIYANVVRRAEQHGRTISVADGQTAAIAAAHNMAVATRDVAPFEASGVPAINPWIEQSN